MADTRLRWTLTAIAAATLGGLAAMAWLQQVRTRSVSPAAASASTTALPTTPRATGPGTAHVTWVKPDPQTPHAPSSSPDDPIAGFRIYTGPTPDSLQLEATVADPAAADYVVKDLPQGTWYFSVTSYTQRGIESERPPPIAKTIR